MSDKLTTADQIDIAFVEADAAARDTRMALDAAFSAVLEAQPNVLCETYLEQSLAAIRSIEQSLSWLHNELCRSGESAIRESCAGDGYKMVGSLCILADELNRYCLESDFVDPIDPPLTDDDIVVPPCNADATWLHVNNID